MLCDLQYERDKNKALAEQVSVTPPYILSIHDLSLMSSKKLNNLSLIVYFCFLDANYIINSLMDSLVGI